MSTSRSSAGSLTAEGGACTGEVQLRTDARELHATEQPAAARPHRGATSTSTHAVDDFSRLAYSEQLTDERKETAADFWTRASAFFATAGIAVSAVMTDNGACYRSHAFATALDQIKHRRTRPYRPQTNGKVERFNRTINQEWAYAEVYTSDDARAATYGDWLHNYNHHRPHTGIGGQVPADLPFTTSRGTTASARARNRGAPAVGHPHNDGVPSPHQWIAFVLASILFIQVPGPSLLFTIGRALTVGRRDALLSVVGNALGVTVQVFLIAVGLDAVVSASSSAYTAVKVVGAVYVIWLGVQAIRHRADARSALGSPVTGGRGRALRTGFVVGLTNPKTIVFFVAFLPQFVNAGAGRVGLQMALLGVVFGTLAACSDSVWALGASRARDWFGRKPDRLDTVGAAGGTMMVMLGAAMLARD